MLVTAYDLTAGANNGAMTPPPGPLNGGGAFASPPWQVTGGDWTFDQTVTLPMPAKTREHIFRYTIALVSANNQIVDIKQSEPFILV